LNKETRATVLLVEDDPGTLTLARKRLEAAGYAVVCAPSAAVAMSHLRAANDIDLILLDYRLPGETGIDFYAELKAAGFDVPAILMTGFANEQTAIAALRAGMRDFIPKGPQFLDYLPDAVERVLRQINTEQRLAGFEQRLAGIIRAATDAIISFDWDGGITLFNPAAERMFEISAADALGQPIDRFFPDALPALKARADAHSPARVELAARSGDGYAFQADVACFEVSVAGQSFHTLIVSDASERKRAEEERIRLWREQAAREQAEANSRAKDMFLATLSHELRTPLQTVLGWLRLLRAGGMDATQVSAALEIIQRNVDHQVALIEDLLDLSRIISGKLQLERAIVDVNRLARELVEASANDARARGVRLSADMADQPIFVHGEAKRLKQVLSNLLTNALKFTPAGGAITVQVAALAGTVRVSVTDTGSGTDPQVLPLIFEPFSQGDSANRHGLGLGLSIARRLIEAHGGKISAHSRGKGHGTTVTFDLPTVTAGAAGAALADAAGPPAPGSELEGLRILVVDDDTDSREVVRYSLAVKRAEVRSAASVAEALRVMGEFTPDVVLTDIAMPGADGYALLRSVREQLPQGAGVPVVAFTAHATKHDQQRALAAGFEAYVAKPVDPFLLANLLSKVHETCRRRFRT